MTTTRHSTSASSINIAALRKTMAMMDLQGQIDRVKGRERINHLFGAKDLVDKLRATFVQEHVPPGVFPSFCGIQLHVRETDELARSDAKDFALAGHRVGLLVREGSSASGAQERMMAFFDLSCAVEDMLGEVI